VKGFGIRRHTTEAVHYLVRYRFNGRQTFKKIGPHGSPWTPDTARIEAQRLLALLASNTDPRTERVRRSETFGDQVQRYLAKRKETMKPRAYLEIERHLMKHAKGMHGARPGEIDRGTIAQRLGEIETASGPAARNRVRSSLSAFFSWAVKQGLLDANPVAGTGKAKEGGSRERVLTQSELAEIWSALQQDQFGDIVRLLILTGQRREEIGALRWEEIDVADASISLPPERTRNRRRHWLPLSPQAHAILERQPRHDSRDLIFGVGRGGFSGWSDCKARLDAAILAKRRETNPEAGPMAPWHLHDIRRTVAGRLADDGTLPHIVGAILNHVAGHKAGVGGANTGARYEAEMRAALANWADHVEANTWLLRPKAVSVRALPVERAEVEAPRATFAERAAWLARLAKK
jgi:integrase